MIRVTSLKKSFGARTIFYNLNFDIFKGKIKAVVGESGKGKTTFLRILSGLEKADEGTIEIDGSFLVKNGKYVKPKEQREILQNVSIVFQNFNLFLNLNVIENLKIVRKDVEKAERLLKKFNLYDKKNRQLNGLSGGEKQRLSIIRALMNNPNIILFDEPTSALDSKNVEEVLHLILELQEEGYTIIVVTHDLKFVEMLKCDVFNL